MSRDSLIPPAELRRLSQKLVDLQGRLDILEKASRSTQLSHSSIEGGSLVIRDVAGLPRSYVGMHADGTSGVRDVNGPPPPKPSTPTVISAMAGVGVSWDGAFALGNRPGDFSHLNVYASGVGSEFIHGPSNFVGTLSNAGSIPVAPVTGMVWARFVAVNTSGELSEPSGTGSGSANQVVADEVLDGIVTETKLAADAVTTAKIAAGAVTETKVADDAISTPKLVAGAVQTSKIAAEAVQAGNIAAEAVTTAKLAALAVEADKIAANAIKAGHIEAGAITTEKLAALLVLAGDPLGNRIQLSEVNGIEQWLDGARTLWIPPSGVANLVGAFRAGTETQYISIEPQDVDTSFPRMFFLDDNSTRRGAIYYQTNSLWMQRETIASDIGAPRGGQLRMADDGTFLAHYRDAGIGEPLGGIELRNDGQAKIYGQNAAGAEMGAWDVQATGHCFLSADKQLFIESRGGGANDVFIRNQSARVWIQAGTDLNFEAMENGGAIFIRNESGAEMRFLSNGIIDVVGPGMNGGTRFGLKPFIIPHPDDPENRWLVHGCTESPMAGVEYWGEAEIIGGEAEVELPSYFESLTLTENRQILLTPIDELCLVAAGRIVNGRFTIRCSGPDGTKVSWLVKAERKDAAGFEVEPLKSDVTVRGDGPYRYIVQEG